MKVTINMEGILAPLVSVPSGRFSAQLQQFEPAGVFLGSAKLLKQSANGIWWRVVMRDRDGFLGVKSVYLSAGPSGLVCSQVIDKCVSGRPPYRKWRRPREWPLEFK